MWLAKEWSQYNQYPVLEFITGSSLHVLEWLSQYCFLYSSLFKIEYLIPIQ